MQRASLTGDLAQDVLRKLDVETSSVLEREILDAERLGFVNKRVFLERRLRNRLHVIKKTFEKLEEETKAKIEVAYSIKTNPDSRVLHCVLGSGLGIEAISLGELYAAQARGFSGAKCTLNGPGKWYPESFQRKVEEPARINCDSAEDFEITTQLIDSLQWSNCSLGIRIAPIGFKSRFGVDIADEEQVNRLKKCLIGVPSGRHMGIHFHLAQSRVGSEAWRKEALDVVEFAADLSKSTGVVFSYFDFGGGWTGSCMGEYRDCVRDLICDTRVLHPSVERFVFEPGRLVVEDCFVALAKVLTVLTRGRRRSAISSLTLFDAQDVYTYPHDIFWRPRESGEWRQLDVGEGKVLGRVCVERDLLRENVDIPSSMRPGDYLAVCQVGGYDASMAFSFGEGKLNY